MVTLTDVVSSNALQPATEHHNVRLQTDDLSPGAITFYYYYR